MSIPGVSVYFIHVVLDSLLMINPLINISNICAFKWQNLLYLTQCITFHVRAKRTYRNCMGNISEINFFKSKALSAQWVNVLGDVELNLDRSCSWHFEHDARNHLIPWINSTTLQLLTNTYTRVERQLHSWELWLYIYYRQLTFSGRMFGFYDNNVLLKTL